MGEEERGGRREERQLGERWEMKEGRNISSYD